MTPPESLAATRAVLLSGADLRVERELRRKDGTTVPVEIVARALADGRILAIARDVSERRRAEALREELRARFQGLAELSPDGILISQGDRYVYANPAAAHILGVRRPAALVGTSPYDITAPADHARARARLARVLAGDTPEPTTYALLRADGGRITVEANSGPATWDGAPAVQVLWRDATAAAGRRGGAARERGEVPGPGRAGGRRHRAHRAGWHDPGGQRGHADAPRVSPRRAAGPAHDRPRPRRGPGRRAPARRGGAGGGIVRSRAAAAAPRRHAPAHRDQRRAGSARTASRGSRATSASAPRRRRCGRARRASARLYDADVMPICFWHADGRVTEANDAYLALTGFSRAELAAGAAAVGRAHRAGAPRPRPAGAGRGGGARGLGTAREGLRAARRAAGGGPLRRDDPARRTAIAASPSLIDLTERKRAEALLRELSARLLRPRTRSGGASRATCTT